MSISTRKLMAKLIGTDEFTAAEEEEIRTSTPDKIFEKINYENYQSEEEESAVLNTLNQNHLPESLYAFTGKEHIYSKLMLTAAIHFGEYENSVSEGQPDEDELYIACKGGYLDALITVAKDKIEKIKLTDENDRLPLIDALFEDLDRLVALYWTVGCIYASQITCQLASLYPEQSIQAQHYYEKAAIYFFFGKDLMEEKQSLALAERLYPGEGYKACGWDSIDKGGADVLSHIPSVKYDGLFKKASKALYDSIGPTIQPLFDLQTKLMERLSKSK